MTFRLGQRRWLVIGLLAALAVALVAGGILLLAPRDEVPPDAPPPAAIAPDLVPLALILGKLRDDASPWLLGTQADTTMNYRFRRAVIGSVNGDFANLIVEGWPAD